MKVIVVDNPFAAMVLELFLGGGSDENPLTKFKFMSEVGLKSPFEDVKPGLKANPDFFTKPDVPKFLMLKVFSNTDTAKMYDVTKDKDGNMYCTCTGFKYRGKCSHVTKVQSYGGVWKGGMGLCLNCNYFSRDERDINLRSHAACSNRDTILCPPLGGCRHFKEVVNKTEKKEVPMTFPIEGTLLQTFQSRHFPEVKYEVRMVDGDLECTCRGFNFHGTCKHVQYMKERVYRPTITI